MLSQAFRRAAMIGLATTCLAKILCCALFTRTLYELILFGPIAFCILVTMLRAEAAQCKQILPAISATQLGVLRVKK
jgi:hypothetical protein